MTSEADTQSTVERLVGRVKWFNNKAGYGFITVTDGSRAGSDIFVHHSNIGVSNQQYKYLVQGEYVECAVTATQSGTHEFQADNVTGIKGGKLMCETRREFKIARGNYKSSSVDHAAVYPEETRQQKSPRYRGEGPRSAVEGDDKKDWTLVKGAKRTDKPSSGRGRGRPPRSVAEAN